jgi:ubiquinone/menaquinone biosynthesis C-methylase UbiE
MLLVDVKEEMVQHTDSIIDFGKIADSYDKWYDTARGAMYDRLEKKAFDHLLQKSYYDKNLLEIGCGTGHWSKYFSEKGFKVVGIDTSEEMINIAGKKNIPNCCFQVADGQNLPFADNSFDIAASITTLEFVENPGKLLSEMARCVKPKGRLLFGVLNSLSSYNRKRKKKKQSLYSYAHLFSLQQFKDILYTFGTVKIRIAGFVPLNKRLIWVSPIWEYLCQLAGSKKGAFIAAEVQL